jgi:hypothetical protein
MLFVILWFGGHACEASDGLAMHPISMESVQQAIQRASCFLSGLVKVDGRFEYRINMDPSVEVKPRYNMLRHAGAIYALATHYRIQPDQKVRASIERAVKYFCENSIDAVSQHPEILAVWSRPQITQNKQDLQAKLGGAGLGIIALVAVYEAIPTFYAKGNLRKLGRFIVYMQKSDGSFYSKFVPSEGGRQDDWESLYYPGEAALGLLMLYDVDPSAVWLQSASNALLYLARIRKKRSDVPADHWALIATEKLLRIEDAIIEPMDRQMLEYHAWQITEAILSEQIVDDSSSDLYGGFVADGRTTPTATRLEGLLASRKIFLKDAARITRIDLALHRGIGFLLRAQIHNGEFQGAFPRAIGKIAPVFQNAEKFNRRSAEVRIDYVQHALCALMQYAALGRPVRP